MENKSSSNDNVSSQSIYFLYILTTYLHEQSYSFWRITWNEQKHTLEMAQQKSMVTLILNHLWSHFKNMKMLNATAIAKPNDKWFSIDVISWMHFRTIRPNTPFEPSDPQQSCILLNDSIRSIGVNASECFFNRLNVLSTRQNWFHFHWNVDFWLFIRRRRHLSLNWFTIKLQTFFSSFPILLSLFIPYCQMVCLCISIRCQFHSFISEW